MGLSRDARNVVVRVLISLALDHKNDARELAGELLAELVNRRIFTLADVCYHLHIFTFAYIYFADCESIYGFGVRRFERSTDRLSGCVHSSSKFHRSCGCRSRTAIGFHRNVEGGEQRCTVGHVSFCFCLLPTHLDDG